MEQLTLEDSLDTTEEDFTIEDLNHLWLEDGLPLFLDDYDIVLMDLKMPIMSGIEVVSKYKHTNNNLKELAK